MRSAPSAREHERQDLHDGGDAHERRAELDLLLERELPLGRALDVEVAKHLLRGERTAREEQAGHEAGDETQEDPGLEEVHARTLTLALLARRRRQRARRRTVARPSLPADEVEDAA